MLNIGKDPTVNMLESKLNDALAAMNICANNQNAYSVEVFELKREKAALESKLAHREREYKILSDELEATQSQLAEARSLVELAHRNCGACYEDHSIGAHKQPCKIADWIDAAGALRAKPEAVSPPE